MLDFDPLVRLGELTIRWQTIGVTFALLTALAVAALIAPEVRVRGSTFRRSSPDLGPRYPEAPLVDAAGWVTPNMPPRLDDMILIVGGIVPGAVIGGRIVHAVVFGEAYSADPFRILDPSAGSLSLLGAVLGGFLSGAYVARLLGAPVLRWADAAAVPMLLAVGLGKIALLLGGSGQGLPFDGPWAVAFGGVGPWISANPDLPSHPAQVYEGLWVLVGIPLVLRFAGPRRRPARVYRLVAWADRATDPGRLFVLAVSWFLMGRVLVGFTWRDDHILGPLNGEQALASALLVVTGAALYLGSRRRWAPAVVSRPS